MPVRIGRDDGLRLEQHDFVSRKVPADGRSTGTVSQESLSNCFTMEAWMMSMFPPSLPAMKKIGAPSARLFINTTSNQEKTHGIQV